MDTTIILIIAVLLVLCVAYLILFRKTPSSSEWEETAKAKLKQLNSLDSDDVLALKNGLIEADKLLDFCLKNSKAKGDTLGERLKNSRNLWDKDLYQKVWDAHKFRNSVVHDMSVRSDKNHYLTAISTLKRAVVKMIG